MINRFSKTSKNSSRRVPRDAQGQHRAYAHYRPVPKPEIVPTAETGQNTRRTFHLHRDSRHSGGRGGSHTPPRTTSAPQTTSSPPLYYFKPVDSSSVKPSASIESVQETNFNPNPYVIYPTSELPKTSPPTPQKYLKKSSSTFRPAGSYDAPKTSIYREDATSKFHQVKMRPIDLKIHDIDIAETTRCVENLRPRVEHVLHVQICMYVPIQLQKLTELQFRI